jgi:dihydroorotase
VLFDAGEPFMVESEALHSRARNTAFEGRRFQGRAKMTFVGGECVFKR